MKKLSSPVLYLKKAFRIYFEKKNLLFFLSFAIFLLALSIGTGIFSSVFSSGINSNMYKQPTFALPLLVSAIGLAIISIWAQSAMYIAVIKAGNGQTPALKETLIAGWKKAWIFFLVSLVRGVIAALGLILLVIPGIIFSVWFSFSLFITMTGKAKTKESLEKSKAMVKGRFWAILGRYLVFMLTILLIEAVFGAVPYVGPVFVVFMGPFFLVPFYLLYKDLA